MIAQRTASFQPRARLVSILGEHLISDHVVGLLELVKNGYDADASCVGVSLAGLQDPDTTAVHIDDDGFGMTTEDVIHKFLSPAVDHKARDKRLRRRTPKGRLPIGEKGVGRFAVQQLGRRLELVTRAQGQPEVVVRIDWDQFDSSEVFLHDISVPVIERTPEVFVGAQTGTSLRITGVRTPWTDASVRKLQRGLRRLQSPHIEASPTGNVDFRVRLACPDYPEYQSLDPGDILDRSHYRFRAVIDPDGQMLYEYRACLPDPGVPERTRESEVNLLPGARDEISGGKPTCGPFYLNLYVWDRTTQFLQTSGISRADLDAMAGVSLFRDHLRVLPYGEPGDDWLHLDRERINNPSERIGNNQVIGFVEVFQHETPELRDKTNREGLIDNPAFRDLRGMVRAAIAFFNTLWQQDRPLPRQAPPRESVPTAARLEEARSVASAIHQTSRSDITVEIPTRPQRVAQGPDGGSTENGRGGGPVPETVSQKEASSRLLTELDGALRAERARATEFDDQRSVLLHLASTGMAAERVVHEFGRQVVAALGALDSIRSGAATAPAVEVLGACLGTLRNEFRVLAPYEGVNRFQRSTTVEVGEAVEVAIQLNQEQLDEGHVGVEIKGGSFSVVARPASLIQVFDNLIHNAAAWARSENGPGRIQISMNGHDRTVTVTDSGPGVPPDISATVFDPFVTTRPGGRGLGLYIVRELLSAGGGAIRLLPLSGEAPGEGATFVVDLAGYPQPDA